LNKAKAIPKKTFAKGKGRGQTGPQTGVEGLGGATSNNQTPEYLGETLRKPPAPAGRQA